MSLQPFESGSRSRRAREGGWLGRRRRYACRQCGNHFLVDTQRPLPVQDRICPQCRRG